MKPYAPYRQLSPALREFIHKQNIILYRFPGLYRLNPAFLLNFIAQVTAASITPGQENGLSQC
jgi:hypothetical protein